MNPVVRIALWLPTLVVKTWLVAVLLVCICIAVGQHLAEATQ